MSFRYGPASRPARRLLIITAVMMVTLASGMHLVRITPSHAASDRYLAVIVLDGFRPDYLQLAPMPNLHTLMHAGITYRSAWVGQLETETPTGHATIVTGVYPRKHGVIGFGWRSAATGMFVWMPTDLRQLGAGAMESTIESGGAATLSDLMHAQYPGSKSVSLSGEKYYAADAMGAGADYILYGHALKHGIKVMSVGHHVPPPSAHVEALGTSTNAYAFVQDRFVANLATHLLATVRPRTMLINLPGTDIEGHLTGGVVDRQDMKSVITHADDAIGQIMDAYRRAGLYQRTFFVVTADHGMVPNKHIVPIKNMYAGIRATGAASIEDDLLTTSGYLFLHDAQTAEKVATGVALHHFAGVEGALYRTPSATGYAFRAEASTQRSLGPRLTQAYLDLANTLASPAGPEVILPYREDTMGLTATKFGPHWGNHGGLSWRVQHVPLILSGPGVTRGVSSFPAELVDVAPTVERLLGLGIPAAVDGVVLADAQVHPSPSDVRNQRAAGPLRSRDVGALIQHSRQQGGLALAP
ncbi:MAG: hypothetical protein PVSMB7_16210 [Chloroflexota bacterium]